MSGPDEAEIRWEEASGWFARARRDIAAARLLLAADPALAESAAFHCQQAGEKFIKGALVAAGTAPPKSHDLARLLALLAAHFGPIAAAFNDVAAISPWALAGRYPDMAEIAPADSEIETALQRVGQLGDAVEAIRSRDT